MIKFYFSKKKFKVVILNFLKKTNKFLNNLVNGLKYLKSLITLKLYIKKIIYNNSKLFKL